MWGMVQGTWEGEEEEWEEEDAVVVVVMLGLVLVIGGLWKWEAAEPKV